jgi:hydrogenase-4 membrane subunit HyfE
MSASDRVPGPLDPWPADIERTTGANARQRAFASWATDILLYIVVLNLYVEYSEAKVINSFTISILTAVLLKVLLATIMVGKSAVWRWAKSRGSRSSTLIGIVGVWAIAFFSKFVILEAVNLVFSDYVTFGGFGEVMLLVLCMVVARELVERIYLWLGRPTMSHHGAV